MLVPNNHPFKVLTSNIGYLNFEVTNVPNLESCKQAILYNLYWLI
jgi:hypothetical protein